MTDMSITNSIVLVMSKQNPIYISESEEEPMEDSYQSSENSEDESSTDHSKATLDHSNDTSVVPPNATVVTPTTAPMNAPEQAPADIPVHASVNAPVHAAVTIPVAASVFANGTTTNTHQLYAEFSRGPTLRRTARMRVGDFTREPLASRGKVPVTEHKIPEVEPPQKRLRPTHLDWMPRVLGEWRTLEGIPTTFELGEFSRSSPPVLLTGEPLETTVPTLVAVVHSLIRMSSNRNREMRELMSNATRIDMDMASLHQRTDFVASHRQTDWQSLAITRTRVATLERRARVTEIVAGICMLTAAMMAAVGFYF